MKWTSVSPWAKAAAAAGRAAAGSVSWASVAADATAAFEKEATAAVSAERKERLTVGRCRLRVSKPVLKAPTVSALETMI
jgi:hypothetical protein